MKIRVFLAGFLAVSAMAQVLSTGPLGETGAQAVVLSENRLCADSDSLNVAYAQYVRGLSKRLDLYVSLGSTRIFQRDQMWIGVGGDAKLGRAMGLDLSVYHVSSFPIQRRHEAATVLADTAVIVSRDVRPWLTAYAGWNTLVPVGATRRGVFTPTRWAGNVAVGVALKRGKHFSLALEGDFGWHLSALGSGASWVP